jgi:hypothetical protein
MPNQHFSGKNLQVEATQPDEALVPESGKYSWK